LCVAAELSLFRAVFVRSRRTAAAIISGGTCQDIYPSNVLSVRLGQASYFVRQRALTCAKPLAPAPTAAVTCSDYKSISGSKVLNYLKANQYD
jgi:hypothetical protein